jgi:glycolate oxidase FAD binding subunit
VPEPATFEEVASLLALASSEGRTVRARGGGTKLGWGHVVQGADAALDLRTTALDRIVEHNAGDLTAILEAGVTLSQAQETFAQAGQMLALDPPGGPAATIGGIIATGDSGPLRHRYGEPRDLLVGVTVALSDGTIARSGGKVIKNVAGYDLAKLFAGSFGTLGVILSGSLRLHPLPVARATTLGGSADAATLAAAATSLAGAPLELEALDVAWRSGRGGLLARSAGAEAASRAKRVALLMRDAGLDQIDVAHDDDALWARQRSGQRSVERAIVRVAARPTALAEVLRICDQCDGTLVGRAALGETFIELDPDAVSRLRAALPRGARSVVLDSPVQLRSSLDPWGTSDDAAIGLMRSVKARFDPAGACNPGIFVGGI